MPYTTVVAGTAITASWATTNVRDQVITSFASAAARDSAITAPVEGMLEHLRDTGQYTWRNSTAWCYLPGTLIARGERTTSSSTTTSEVGVLRLPVGAVPAGQVLQISTSALWFTSSEDTDVIDARIRYTTDGSAPSTSSAVLPVASARQRMGFKYYAQSATVNAIYVPSAAETITLLLTVRREAGTGNVFFNASATNYIGLYVYAGGTDTGDDGVDI